VAFVHIFTEHVCVTDKNRKLQEVIKSMQEKQQQRDKVETETAVAL